MTQQLPPDLVRYEQQLTDAIRDRIDARRARRRRITPLAAAGAAAAVAAGVTAAALTSTGGGLSPQVADAAVLRHAVQALDQPPGTILHVALTETDRAATGTSTTDEREVWMLPVAPGTSCDLQDCPAEYLRTTFQGAGSAQVVDSSTNADEVTDLWDSSTDTVYDAANRAASWQAPEPLDSENLSGLDPFSTVFASQLQRAIGDGRAHVVGSTTADSQRVVQIAGETDLCEPATDLPPGLPARPSQDGQPCEELASWNYDVTPVGDRPVRLESHSGTSTTTIDFHTWETLDAAQNMDVFSLTAQHPSARVNADPADYQAEATRFDEAEHVTSDMTSTFPSAPQQARHRP